MLLFVFFSSTIVIIGLIVVFWRSLFGTDYNPPPAMLVTITSGALGALFSGLIRLYNFENMPVAILKRNLDWREAGSLAAYSLVPVLVGAIAAAIAYVAIAGEVITGPLFPTFACRNDGGCREFKDLIENWTPDHARGYAKMIV